MCKCSFSRGIKCKRNRTKKDVCILFCPVPAHRSKQSESFLRNVQFLKLLQFISTPDFIFIYDDLG